MKLFTYFKGPSSGHRACLRIRWSEFESRWNLRMGFFSARKLLNDTNEIKNEAHFSNFLSYSNMVTFILQQI